MLRILPFLFSIILLSACTPAESPDFTPQNRDTAEDSLARTAEGHPDLNGVWQAMNTANWNLEPHAAGQGSTEILGAIAAMPPGKGFIEGGSIPYLAEALPRRESNYLNRRTEDPEAKCFRPGVPRATYMPYPFQIFQNESEVFIAYQYASANRTINMQEQEPAPFDTWMGWSNGHWEGDTLVVEVTGLNGESWLDRAGNYVTGTVRITERYTPEGPDHLWYEATIEDPAIFSAHWTISMPLYRHIQNNPEFLEFKCVEYAEEMMYGHLAKPADDEGGSDNE
jgi:hypothetical protein